MTTRSTVRRVWTKAIVGALAVALVAAVMPVLDLDANAPTAAALPLTASADPRGTVVGEVRVGTELGDPLVGLLHSTAPGNPAGIVGLTLEYSGGGGCELSGIRMDNFGGPGRWASPQSWSPSAGGNVVVLTADTGYVEWSIKKRDNLDDPITPLSPGDYSATFSNPTKSNYPRIFVYTSCGQASVRYVDIPPTPTCTVTSQVGPGGSEVVFEGSVTNPGTAGYLQEWQFPDGSTEPGAVRVARTATRPGPFQATYRIWRSDGTLDRSAVCTAEVGATDLSLNVVVGDGSLEQLDPDDEFDVTVRASVSSDGIGAFTGIVLTDPPLIWDEDRFELIAEPTLPAEPAVLDRGEQLAFTWRFKPLVAGRTMFRSTAVGIDPFGAVVERPASTGIRIGDAVDAEMVLDPAVVTIEEIIEDETGGGAEREPVLTTATITVTNSEDRDIENVTWPSEVDIIATDRSPVADVRVRQQGGPRLPGGGDGPPDLRPFTLASGESRSIAFVLEVVDDGEWEIRARVQYDDELGGRPLAVFAQTELVAGPDASLGIKLDTERGQTLGFLTGGEQVRLTGNLYNFSSTDTLEVDLSSLIVSTTGNAVVKVYRPLEDDIRPDECYLAPDKVVIGPGERFPIHGLLITSSEGGTRGTVDFDLPTAVAVKPNGTRTTLDPETFKVQPTPTGFAFQVDTSSEVLPTWGAAEYATFSGYLAYGAYLGAMEWLVTNIRAAGELLLLVRDWEALSAGAAWLAPKALNAAKVYYDFWYLMNPIEKAEFIADVGQKAYDLAIEAGKSGEAAQLQRAAAEAVLPGWFSEVEAAYATNDPRLLGQAFGRVGGNVGLEVMSCVMPNVKWKGKFQQLGALDAAAAADEAAALGRSVKAGSKLAAKQAGRAGLRNGAWIDVTTASSLWGVGVDAYRALLRFADENKLLITLRDRTEGSIRRLQQGWIEKMEHMKLKNVRPDIDAPLGYLDRHADVVAFKKPISQSELDDVLASIADADLRKEVAARHAQRTKEWNRYGDLYESYELNGFPSGFDYGPNAATGAKNRTRIPFRLDPVKDAAGNVIADYYIPQVFTDGAWRGFTGDLDIVDIRHATGRALSADDARRVYDMFADSPINLRHGDTIHWLEGANPAQVLKSKIEQLSPFFKGANDKLVQFAPDGARAVQLDAEKTFIVDRLANPTSRESYAVFDGGYKQAVGQAQFAGRTFEGSWDQLNPLYYWIAPTEWLLDGADGTLGVCQPVADASQGVIVRQDANGATLEAYRDGVWSTFDTDACLGASGAGNRSAESAFSAEGTVELSAQTGDAIVLAYKPQTALASAVGEGDDRLDIHDLPVLLGDAYVGDWFEVGDEVLIDPGGPKEERRTVVGFGSLILDRPLDYSHDPETMVTVVFRSNPTDPPTPVDPPTPTDPPNPVDPGTPTSPATPVIPSTPSKPAASVQPGSNANSASNAGAATRTDASGTDGTMASTGGGYSRLLSLLASLVLMLGLLLAVATRQRVASRRSR